MGLGRGDVFEEVLGSFYKVVTQRHVRFLPYFLSWVFLGKLWGHEDVLNDGAQNVGVGISGSRGRHDCRG